MSRFDGEAFFGEGRLVFVGRRFDKFVRADPGVGENGVQDAGTSRRCTASLFGGRCPIVDIRLIWCSGMWALTATSAVCVFPSTSGCSAEGVGTLFERYVIDHEACP